MQSCFYSITRIFDYLVEEIFNSDGYELDGPLEELGDIAAYALHAYSEIANISKSMAVNFIFDIIVEKQKMYGPKNIEKFGLRGIIIRLNDKIERLKNLQQHQGPVLFEPIQDTWLDIVGYSVIGIMWIHGWFLLEMKKDSTSKKN
jgi:hypothetical protein